MPEQFVVYDLGVNGKSYLRILRDGSFTFNGDYLMASSMEKPVAAAWVALLSMKEPTGIFGIDGV